MNPTERFDEESQFNYYGLLGDREVGGVSAHPL